MMMEVSFVLPIWKTEPGWNILASPTCCVHVSLDWLPITLLSANIDKGFSLSKACNCGNSPIEIRTHGTQSKNSSKMFHISHVQSRCILLSRRHYIDLEGPSSLVVSITEDLVRALEWVFKRLMSRLLTVDFILFSLFIFILLFISFSFSFFYF